MSILIPCLKETEWVAVDRMCLAQGRDRAKRRAFTVAVMSRLGFIKMLGISSLAEKR